MEFHHISAMPAEVIEYLNLRPGKIYVDGTLGGAGHSKAILEKIAPDGKLIGIDQDIDAINNAKKVLKPFEENLTIVHDNFANLPAILEQLGISSVDGILVDIGLSQHQLEGSGRGFSFQREEPLDMRMNIETERSAADLVNELDARELADIFFKYGEERYSRQIVKKIIDARNESPIETSKALADIVSRAVPGKAAAKQKIHPATRVFQALRIAVNGELERLETFMDCFSDYLNPGGRLCVLSFHSLEDRIVKKKIRELATDCICPPDFPVCACSKKQIVRALTRKAVKPTEEEIRSNPMARSTRLRAAEKL